MAASFEDKIARILEKQQKLDARLNALKQKAKTESRKRETRQKIILGGAVMAQMEKDEAFAASIRAMLNATVERPNDREAIAELLTPSSAAPQEDKAPEQAHPSPATPLIMPDKSAPAAVTSPEGSNPFPFLSRVAPVETK